MTQNDYNTPDENGILFAMSIDGQGGGTHLQGSAIADTLHSDQLAWVHMDVNAQGTRDWLKREVGYLDHIILDALLADETRPRMMEFEQGVLLILRGVNLNENEEPHDMISIRMWIDPHRIITMRRRKLSSVRDMRERLEEGKGPQDAGEFLAMITARLFERMEPVLQELDETTDDVEEEVLEKPDTDLREKIIDVRKQAILLRRYIAPQKDVMMMLRTSEQQWIDTGNRRRLQESLDRIIRYVEDLDAIRERSQIVKDELANALADKLNKNMYVLSVIAAIFLPLGFFTGLMGINIGGMPGVDNADAFWIFSAILAGIVILQIIIFKKLKWF